MHLTRGHTVDSITRFERFMHSIRARIIYYLEYNDADIGYVNSLIPGMVETCHALVDRREAFIRTGRRGTRRKEWQGDRDIPTLYARLHELSNRAGRRRELLQELIDEMQIMIELAVEYFQLGTKVWEERIEGEKKLEGAA